MTTSSNAETVPHSFLQSPRIAAPALSVRSNFVWTLLGNAFGSAAQWALVVILARFGDAAMVGQYAIGQAIVSPLFTFASLHLRGLQATDFLRQFRFVDYLGVRLATAAAAFGVSLLALFCGSSSSQTVKVGAAVAAAKCLDAVGDTVYGHLQRIEVMDRIAKSMILKGALSAAALSLIVWRFHDAAWGVAGAVAASLLILTFYDFPNILKNTGSPQLCAITLRPAFARLWPNMKSLALLAGPLGFLPLLASLNGYQARYWLAHYRSETEVGIFSAIAYIIVAANTFVVALGQAAGPTMARSFIARDRKRFYLQAGKLGLLGLALGTGGIAIAWLWGGQIMALCYGPAYAQHPQAMLWLMIAGAFGYLASCAGYTLSSARCFVVQLPILVLVNGIIAAASFALIPHGGILGAAQAQAIGFAGYLLLSLFLIAKLFPDKSSPADH